MRQSLRLVSGLYLKLSLLTIAVGFLLRIVLLFNEQTTDLGFSFGANFSRRIWVSILISYRHSLLALISIIANPPTA